VREILYKLTESYHLRLRLRLRLMARQFMVDIHSTGA
jgi:hypothetical protein